MPIPTAKDLAPCASTEDFHETWKSFLSLKTSCIVQQEQGRCGKQHKLAFYDLKSLRSVDALYLFFLHSRVNKIETTIGMTAYPAFFSPRANSTYPAPQAVIKENSKLNVNKMAGLLISNHHLLTCVL